MKLGLRYATFLTGSTLAGCLVVAALGSQACTVSLITGPSDGGGFDFPDTSEPPSTTDSCGVCLYPNCSALHAYCDNNAECLAIYSCSLQVGANPTACYQQHPSGQTAYLALAQCDQRNACTTCGTQCATSAIKSHCEDWVTPTPPPDAGTTPVDAGTTTPVVDQCQQCLGTSCSAQQAACTTGTECAANHNCIQGCAAGAPTQLNDCIEACGSVHPEGKVAADALGTCTGTSCSAQCFPAP